MGYWVLVRWVPVPGAGVPGRDIPFLDKNQNIVAWVDRHLMPGHLYEDWPAHNARDPEGLLSDIPALGTALLGLLTGAVAAHAADDEGEDAGTGCGRGGLPGIGLSVVDLVSAEQEDVDQLLCAGGGGMVAGAACAVLLGHGAEWLGQGRRSKAAGLAVAGLWIERDRGLHDQRTAGQRHRADYFTFEDGQTDRCTGRMRRMSSSKLPTRAGERSLTR